MLSMIEHGSITPFEPSERCRMCPAQNLLTHEINGLKLAKMMISHAANGLVGSNGAAFDRAILEMVEGDESLADELTTKIRQGTSMNLDRIDERIGKLEEDSQTMERSCDTPLKMRAKKCGREYTVAVCTSALNYLVNEDEPGPSPAFVWVKTD